MADTDQAYVDNLIEQLCTRHASLLATAEDDLAVLRARIALVVRFIHDLTHDRAAREALARDLQLPEPVAPKGAAQ